MSLFIIEVKRTVTWGNAPNPKITAQKAVNSKMALEYNNAINNLNYQPTEESVNGFIFKDNRYTSKWFFVDSEHHREVVKILKEGLKEMCWHIWYYWNRPLATPPAGGLGSANYELEILIQSFQELQDTHKGYLCNVVYDNITNSLRDLQSPRPATLLV